MTAPRLSPQEAMAFKIDMWNGLDNNQLMEKYQVNYQLVVGIKAGRMYNVIPWPDGSSGPLAKTRKDWIANNKRNGHLTSKALDNLTIVPGGSPELRADMEPILREQGFMSVEAALEFNKNAVREERRQQELAKHEAWMKELDTPEGKARIAELNSRRAPPEPTRDDIVNPEANERADWDYILQVGGDVPMVEVANEGNDPALKEAIRVAFKLIGPRQWKQDHMLKLVYSIKAKIERYWEEFGGAPEIETNCFKLS